MREKESMWGVGRVSTESLGKYLVFGDINFSSVHTSDLTNRTLPINVPLEHKIKLKPTTKLKTSCMSLTINIINDKKCPYSNKIYKVNSMHRFTDALPY